MLTISPGVVATFEQRYQRSVAADFRSWWAAQAPILPPTSLDQLDALFRHAMDRVGSIGLDVTDEHRARLYIFAAGWGLCPAMTGDQFVLIADIVFSDADDTAKLVAIVDIAAGAVC